MTASTRVVFDCNVYLQALAAPEGPAGRCVQLAIDGEFHLFISPAVLEELRDVTSRPNVIAKLHLIPQRVEELLEAIQIAATVLAGFGEIFSYPRDPDDAHYVNLALAAGARLVVSRDKDLLDLMDSSNPDAAAFQNRFPAASAATRRARWLRGSFGSIWTWKDTPLVKARGRLGAGHREGESLERREPAWIGFRPAPQPAARVS